MQIPSARQEFFMGIRDELPILIGVIPFGMIYGILALSAGLSPTEAQAMSIIVFAGSAQLILVQLAGIETPTMIMILTGFLINLRHALYSISIAPYTRQLHSVWKAMLSYLLTDEAYAVTITHYIQGERHQNKQWHFLGAGFALWASWQTSTALGVFLGTQVPPNWPLDFTLALTFIALLIPRLIDRPSIFAAISAGCMAVLTIELPFKLHLLIAAIVGISVGLLMEEI
ncbi:MAG: AzlC family ABC transporter permease [Chloroflexi bacterium]|nr:AzlC family ABC transporter permease [Chloroflexota bacterium]